jgi:hypothetical protein
VRDFRGEWDSKTKYQKGITLENTSRFLGVALKELRRELLEVLTFLSNDKYFFTFVRLQRDRTDQQQYLEYGELEDWPF